MLEFYNVGLYPYKQYSVIQGGDGGMEYAMCTGLLRMQLGSLAGVTRIMSLLTLVQSHTSYQRG
jgi:hypothetical protein